MGACHLPPRHSVGVTVRQALAGVRNTAAELKRAREIAAKFVREIRWLRAAGQYGRNYQNCHPLAQRYKQLLAAGQRAPELLVGLPSGRAFRQFIVLDPDAPSPTVCAVITLLVHWREDRILTIRELQRVCSFPEDFKL